jgi:hypothetical protein
MSGPTPLQPQGPLILEALRLVEAASAGEALLPALAGAEVKAVLAEIQAQGLLLLLADGRRLTATGELPYPPGTTLTFRVQPQPDGSTQLQPLRADPPLPPPLLAPLLQGEASALLQRLSAPELPAALLPLKELLARLPGPPATDRPLPAALAPLAEALGLPTLPEAPGAAAPAPTPSGPSAAPLASPTPDPRSAPTATPTAAAPLGPNPPPTPETASPLTAPLTAALVARGVPPESAPRLAALLAGAPLPAPGDPLPDPLPALRPGALEPHRASALGDPGPEALAPQPGSPTPPPLTPEALGRLLQATARLGGPTPSGPVDPALPAKVRDLLERLPPALAQRVVLLLHLLPPAGQGTPLASQDPLAQLLKALLPEIRAALARSEAAAGSPASSPLAPPRLDPAQPATWERWLRSTMEALARPESSPQEAPFHRLQAREGTALFEVPVPWLAERPQIELWAERDPGDGEGDPTSRVLLALDLGRTGELRVALQAGPGGTRAQVVAGATVAAELATLLQEELGEPAPFPVQVRASETLPPRPRAQAGQGLRALG